jgi:GxxExxY protein
VNREGAKTRRVFGDCSGRVIGACIEVHRALGPGLLESAYEQCLAHELGLRQLHFQRQQLLPVVYKGRRLDAGYRLDFVVEGHLIVELKAVENLLPIHEAQLITYLRLTGISAGLLVNFHAESIQRGLRRVVLTPKSFASSRLPVQSLSPQEGRR